MPLKDDARNARQLELRLRKRAAAKPPGAEEVDAPSCNGPESKTWDLVRGDESPPAEIQVRPSMGVGGI